MPSQDGGRRPRDQLSDQAARGADDRGARQALARARARRLVGGHRSRCGAWAGAGLRPHGWADTATMSTALIGVSMPSFWIGMLLIYVFGLMLEWVPILGDGIDALILPSITVGLFLAGGLARLIRSAIIETMSQDYIRTAHAKGLSALRIVAKHAMRNAIIPPITLLGVQFAFLIGGAVVTERVYARPGLGSLLIDAVLTKDIPLVQGLVVYTTSAYILINLALELLYGVVDPRIRSRRA
ncbi:MAG: ABC transporter permease [Alphaproteobacteria bacterium]|nr:ABC transporter permease [Alphaproteobacteria bacterium]